MLDVVATMIVDSGLVKWSRPWVVTALTLLSFLMCLPYCTEFGYYLLDGVDRWINNVVLIFVVWSEVVSATTVYRWQDTVSQTGMPAFVIYNFGYFAGQFIGVGVAHATSEPGAGVGAGLGIYAACSVLAVLVAKTPIITTPPTGFWNRNNALRGFHTLMGKFSLLAFYSVCVKIYRCSDGRAKLLTREINSAAI